MTGQQAENAITAAAGITAGVYFLRRAVEGESSSPPSRHAVETYTRAFGSGPVLPLGQWLPAAGVTFIGLALIGAASPAVGGAAAALVATGTILGNGIALQKDLKVSTPEAAESATPATSPQTTLAANHPPVSKGVLA